MFFCCHPTLGLQLGLVSRDFVRVCVWGGGGQGQFFSPGPYRFLIQAGSPKKTPLSSTIVIIHSDKALINQRNGGDVIKLAIKISKLLVYLFLTEFNFTNIKTL